MPQGPRNLARIRDVVSLSAADTTSLETRVEDHYVPRLFSKTLIDRASFEGRMTVRLRKWTPIDKPDARWPVIFKEALTHIPETALAGLSHTQISELYALKYRHITIDQESESGQQLDRLKAQLMVSDQNRPKLAEVDWAQDPRQLRKLSLLSSLPKQPVEEMTPSLLNTLYEKGSGVTRFNFLPYVLKHLSAAGKRFTDAGNALQQAINFDQSFRDLVVRNIGKPHADSKAELAKFSQDFAKSLAALQPGEQRMIFGGTPAVAPTIGAEFTGSEDSILKIFGFCMSPNATSELAKQLSDYLSQYAHAFGNSFSEEHQTKFREVLKDGLVAVLLPQVKRSLFEGRSSMSKVAMAPLELLRMGTEAALEYGCNSYVNGVAEQYLSFLTPDQLAKMRQAAIDGELTTYLQANAQIFFNEHATSIRTLFAQNFSSLTEHLPPLANEILKRSGYGNFGCAEQNIGFEITRQQNGKFTLSVYASGSAVQIHPSTNTPEGTFYQTPLHYEDLTLEQLDEQFILRLFSHRAWPEWGCGGPYTINEIHESLLHTLDVAPKSLQEDPKTLSPDAHLMHDSWGFFKLFLRTHASFTSSLEERMFYFNLRKNAFLDAWKNVQQDWQSLGPQSQTLKNLSEDLIQEALTLFDDKAVTFDDLKVLYATVWEAQDLINKLNASERQTRKATLIPNELRNSVAYLVDSVGAELVKDLLVGSLGRSVEEPVNALLREVEVKRTDSVGIVQPSRWDLLWEIQGWVLSELGISLNDLRNPTWRKTAFMVVRVASRTLLPALSMNLLIGYVAQRALRQLCNTFLPGPMKRLNQLKLQLFAKVATDLFLNDAQREHFSMLLNKWRALLTQTGEITYDLAAQVSKRTPTTVKWISEGARRTPPLVPVTRALRPSLEHSTKEINAKNALESMHRWMEELKALLPYEVFKIASSSLDNQTILEGHRYLLEKVQSLPVPAPVGQRDLWDELSPDAAMESIGAISLYLHNLNDILTVKSMLSFENRHRTAIALFKIYAIIDKLSRRWPENPLKEKSNPWIIAGMQRSIHFRLIDRHTRGELEQIKRYFGLDPKRTYTAQEIDAMSADSLLGTWGTPVTIRGESCGNARETAWFKSFLQEPATQEKLELCGVAAETPLVDKLSCLYQDQSNVELLSAEKVDIKRVHELFDGDRNPRLSILPRYFHMLRLIHGFSHSALSAVTSKNYLQVLMNDVNESLIGQAEDYHFAERPANMFVAGIGALTRIRKLKDMDVSFRTWSQAKTTVTPRITLNLKPDMFFTHEIGFSDHEYWFKDTNLDKSPSSTPLVSRFKSHWYQKPRGANEIVNSKPTFTKCRPTAKFFQFLYAADGDGLPSSLDKLTPLEKMELEKIWSNPKDQAVRTFSFLSKILHKLTHTQILGICLKLSLNDNFLDSQLEDHLPFVTAVGEFFHQALNVMKEEAPFEDDALSHLIYFGTLARAKCESYHKEAGMHFPDFRPHIIARADKCLLCMPYAFIAPEFANSATVHQAVEDFCIAHIWNQKSRTDNELYLMFQDAELAWRSTIIDVLNRNRSLRNRILTKMAIIRKEVGNDVQALVWTGQYPDFSCDGLTISFEKEYRTLIQSKDETNKSQILGLLRKVLGDSFLPGSNVLLQHSPNCYRITGHEVYVDIDEHQQNETRFRVRKMIDGEAYYWVSLDQADSLKTTTWIQARSVDGISKLLVFEKDVIKHQHSVHRGLADNDLWEASTLDVSAEEVDFFDSRCEIVPCKDLAQHGLHALAWFQPLSSVQVYRSLAAPHDMKGFVFKNLNVTFRVLEEQGKKYAYAAHNEALDGFRIVPEQRSQKSSIPALENHSSYLLLENEQNVQKVLLTTDSIWTSLITGFVQQWSSLPTSRLIENQMTALLRKFFDGSAYMPTHSHIVCQLDSQGRLSNDDPEAILMLLMHTLCQDRHNYPLIRHYLKQFEIAAGEGRLSEKVRNFASLFELYSTFGNDAEIMQISLRLAASIEMNRLIFPIDKPQVTNNNTLLEVLMWMCRQRNYYRCYVTGAPHMQFISNEVQEWFVLKSLTFAPATMVAKILRDSKELAQLIEAIGLDQFAAAYVLDPTINDRLELLTHKYAAEGEVSSLGFKAFLRNVLIQSESQPKAKGVQVAQKQSSNSLQSKVLNALLSQGMEFSVSVFPTDSPSTLIPNVQFSQLPVHFTTITPKNLQDYFLFYYSISTGKILNCWKGNPEAEAFFKQQVEAFPRTLAYLKGTYSTPKTKTLLSLLLTASNYPKAFMDPTKLEALKHKYDAEYQCFQKAQKELAERMPDPTPALRHKAMGKVEQRKDEAQVEVNKALTEIVNQYKAFQTLSDANISLLGAAAKSCGRTFAKNSAMSFASYMTGLGVLAPWLSSGAYWTWRGARAYNRMEGRRHKALQERAHLEEDIKVQDQLIPEEWQKRLLQEDQSLGEFITWMRTAYFSEQEVKRKREGAAGQLSSPRPERHVQRYVAGTNQSLADHYSQAVVPSAYTPKSLEDLYALRSVLQSQQSVLSQHLQAEKEALVDWATQPIRDQRSDEEHIADLIRNPPKQITSRRGERDELFESVITALGKQDYTAVLAATSLKDSQLPTLKLNLLLHFIKARRADQMQRTISLLNDIFRGGLPIDHPETQVILKNVLAELSQGIVHDYAGSSERALFNALLFEYRSHKMLRPKQLAIPNKILTSHSRQMVVEQGVGTGKSTWLMPYLMQMFANGVTTPFGTFPDALFPSQSPQLLRANAEIFGQCGTIMHFNRSSKLGERELEAHLRVAMQAKLYKGSRLGRKKDLQALLLRFLEHVYYLTLIDAPPDRILRLHKLLLRQFINGAMGLLDEAHDAFRRTIELNFPLTSKKELPKKERSLLLECARLLVTVPEINEILKIRENRQHLVDAPTYHEKVKPLLAYHLSFYKPFKIQEEQRKEFIAYLCGDTEHIPAFVQKHPYANEIGLAVGMCKMLETILSCKVNEKYGQSKLGQRKAALLFSANDTPSEDSTIKNPHEAVMKTHLMYLHTGLKKEEAAQLARYMNERAKAYAKPPRNMPKSQTPDWKRFLLWSGGMTLNEWFEGQNKEEVQTHLMNAFNNSPNAILSYAELCVTGEIKDFEESLSCSSHDFARLVKGFVSPTGTPDQDGVFPAQATLMRDKGTAGDFIDMACTPGKTSTRVLVTDSPKENLREILTLFQQDPKLCAIVDGSAMFTGISNENVAKIILQGVEELGLNKTAVKFYLNDRLYILQQGFTVPIPAEQCRVPLDQCITYFDQHHSEGADIHQPLNGGAVATFGKDITLEQLKQHLGRMRAAKTGAQYFLIVLTKRVRDRVVSDGSTPTPHQLITFATVNDADQHPENNYASSRNELNSALKMSVIRKMILDDDDRLTLELARQFRDLLVDRRNTNCLESYGQPQVRVAGETALETVRGAKFSRAKESSLLSAREIGALQMELDSIGRGRELPATVTLFRGAQGLKDGHVDLEVAQEVELTQNNEQEQKQALELQQMQELAIDQNLNTNREVEINLPPTQRLRDEPAVWGKDEDYMSASDWLEPTSPHDKSHHRYVSIHSVRESMLKMKDEEFAVCGRAIDPGMLWTNNFVGILEAGRGLAQPCSKSQQPLQTLLVVFSNEEGALKINTLALHSVDADHWRERIRENRHKPRANPKLKFALFDLKMACITITGKNALLDEELWRQEHFCKMFMQWNFLAGNMNVTHKLRHLQAYDIWVGPTFRKWILDHDKERMLQVLEVINSRHNEPQMHSEASFLFAETDGSSLDRPYDC